MGNQAAIFTRRRPVRGDWIAKQDYLLRQGILKLLAVKDSDIRILTLEQCRDAVDKGLHAGGAFSATIPLVALFYGGLVRRKNVLSVISCVAQGGERIGSFP